MGGLKALKRLFELRGVLAQLQFFFIFAKIDMVDGQLHENNGSYATSGSKVMTQSENKLKSSSKSDEVASVGFKNNKACL